jgi:hypothetical protein
MRDTEPERWNDETEREGSEGNTTATNIQAEKESERARERYSEKSERTYHVVDGHAKHFSGQPTDVICSIARHLQRI